MNASVVLAAVSKSDARLVVVNALSHFIAFVFGCISAVIFLLLFCIELINILSVNRYVFEPVSNQKHIPSRESSKINVSSKSKLYSKSSANSQDSDWLNKLLSHTFTTFCADSSLKDSLLKKLQHESSNIDPPQNSPTAQTSRFLPIVPVLGDLQIHDINLGNTPPVLSNLRLESSTGSSKDLQISADIMYHGGSSVLAASMVTISVPFMQSYFGPLQIPLAISVHINRISARILLKFDKSNRMFFGIYQDPPIQLELSVHPIIADKILKLQLINQLIERRVIHVLNSVCVLPNMDDWSFWKGDHIFNEIYSLGLYRNNFASFYSEMLEPSYPSLDLPDVIEESIFDKLHIETTEKPELANELDVMASVSLNTVECQRKASADTIAQSRHIRERILKGYDSDEDTSNIYQPRNNVIYDEFYTNNLRDETAPLENLIAADIPVISQPPSPNKSLRHKISEQMISSLISSTHSLVTAPATVTIAKKAVSVATCALEYFGVLETMDSETAYKQKIMVENLIKSESSSKNTTPAVTPIQSMSRKSSISSLKSGISLKSSNYSLKSEYTRSSSFTGPSRFVKRRSAVDLTCVDITLPAKIEPERKDTNYT
ncbi:hypothetical protein HK096_001875 [Nowakowskiella sp. JEL0078]|nr:hypothetical protein HK096_001875 [Nowakowskiella sp. JEL0078]